MTDLPRHNKFVRAVGLAITGEGVAFSHDYGQKAFPWESISHAFAVVLKKKTVSHSLLFILLPIDSQVYFYIDSNMISTKYLTIDGREPEHPGSRLDLSLQEVKKSKEEEFRKIVREVCTRASFTYIDKPLRAYLRGNQDFLPLFSTLREITDYCVKTLSSRNDDDEKGIQASELDEEKLNRLSTAAKEREEWKEGTLIDGRYTVQEVLKGGMGIVYIAFDPGQVRFIAIKTFQERYLWDEYVIKQFIKEAEIWINLERHPHIVQAELVKIIEGRPCIFLEYIPGTDLEKLLMREKLPLRRALELALQFCEGMYYVFKKLGLIHRDIKPSNCLITRDGVLKITDFGLGKIFDEAPVEGDVIVIPRKLRRKKVSSSSSSTTMVGTLPFMAPELFSDIARATVKTDIYSFGIVLYMLLTGVNPFYSDDPLEVIENQQTVVPLAPFSLSADIPERISALTMKCIEKNPRGRPVDFMEIKRELDQIYIELYQEPFIGEYAESTFSEEDWINKGQSLASIGRHMEAILTFEQALRLNSRSFKAHVMKGASLIEMGKLMESLASFDEALKIDTDRWEPWLYRGEAHWKMGKIDTALTCFDRALEMNTESALILGLKGKLLAELGKYDRALSCYNSALSLDSRADEIWDEKGSVLLAMKYFEEALECFKEALQINPRSRMAWYHHGIALYNLSYFQEAIASEEKALTLDPEFSDAYAVIGECQRECGNEAGALESFSTAIKIQPGEIGPYLSTMSLLRSCGRGEEALDFIQKAMEIEPDNLGLLIDQAEILYTLGFFDESHSLCTVILELDADNKRAEKLMESINSWNDYFDGLLFQIKPKTAPTFRRNYETLNEVLVDFCSFGAARAFLVETGKDDPITQYIIAALDFIEGNYLKASQWLLDVGKDYVLAGQVAALRHALDDVAEEQKLSGLKERGLIGSLFKKDECDDRSRGNSAARFFLSGLEKVNRNLYDEARQCLKEAFSLDNSLSASLYYIALSYARQERIEDCASFDREFRRLNPHSLFYWKMRIAVFPGSDPAELEKTIINWLIHTPWDLKAWLGYCSFLSECNYREKLRALASRLLNQSLACTALSPESCQYWNLKGTLEATLKRYRAARLSFARSLEIDAGNTVAQLASGISSWGLQDFEQSSHEFGALLDHKEMGAYAACGMAELYARKESFDEALSVIERAIGNSRGHDILLFAKAKILLASRQYMKLLNFYSQIYSKGVHLVPLRLLRSIALYETQKVDDAILELQSVHSKEPYNTAILENLGYLQLRTQQLAKAQGTFDTIFLFHTLGGEVHRGRGVIFYLLKKYPEARESFTTALRLNPLDPDLWQFLGATSFHLNDFSEASHCWDQALCYKGRSLQVLTNKGIFLYHNGSYRDALEITGQVLRKEPEHFYALMCRSRCQWKMGKSEDALRSVEKALSVSPQNLDGWSLKGIIEFYSRQYDMSMRSFDKAIGLEGKKAELHYNRALVALYLVNQPEANRSLDRALALNPQLFEALIARFAYEKKFKQDLPAQIYSSQAQKLDPRKFQEWSFQFQESRDPLTPLKPLEVADDTFDLPYYPAFVIPEPFDLFSLVAAGCPQGA